MGLYALGRMEEHQAVLQEMIESVGCLVDGDIASCKTSQKRPMTRN